MSKPPPYSDHTKKPELSPPSGPSTRQTTAKHPRPWNSSVMPAEKEKPTASPPKQPSKHFSKQTPSQPQQQLPKKMPKQTPNQTPKQTVKQMLKELPKQMQKQPPKQLTKAGSSHSSAARSTAEISTISSARGIHEGSLLHKRDFKTAVTTGSPARKLPASTPKGPKVRSLRGIHRSPRKDDGYFSSLPKRSSLDLSLPLKDSDARDIQSQSYKGATFDTIYDKKVPIDAALSSDIEARCFFGPRSIAENDGERDLPSRAAGEPVACARIQPSRRTGKLRSPVGIPEDESRESWLPRDNLGRDWQQWDQQNSIRESDSGSLEIPQGMPAAARRLEERVSFEDLRHTPMRAMPAPRAGLPHVRPTQARYRNPEAHILAIDPYIMIQRPRARRSATVSDPVHPTAPVHEGSLNHQARQYYNQIYHAQIPQGDAHAFQIIPKVGSQHYGGPEDQGSKSISQAADQESAYQAMLKKAHYKPDHSHPCKPPREETDHKITKREKDAPLSQIVMHVDVPKNYPKIVMEPTSATIGRYLQPSSENIIRTNNTILRGEADKPHKAEPKKNTIRAPRRPRGSSPIYRPIREPLSPNKHGSRGRAEGSYAPNGWFVDQPQRDGKEGFPRSTPTTKSTLSPAENRPHSAQPVILPTVNHTPSTSSPRRMQNKSVSWDPAITLIGPVTNPAGERPTAEAMFKKLFAEGGGKGAAEGNETPGDKDVDAFVSTLKRWKKGDRSKLDSLLKALREIETDTDNDSANGETVNKGMQGSGPDQTTTTGFDPRVPAFKPLVFRENEIWVQKVRSHMAATSSASAAKPIAPATINIPFRAEIRGRPRWPTPGNLENTMRPYQHSLRANTRPSSSGDSQPIKKRVIWDNPDDPGGREAVMQSQRWAGELLERFTKKYPLTGQKAAVIPKKRLEDLPLSRPGSNTLKVTKMESDAADIQQKLELLLMQKNEAKSRGSR
ncbi:hypothetical protein V494_02512 [Pseudogymnoascus sp. VKM F-4513 (FW-928)]|nr:hypothetical protein V494_02512 [Pseudogymnoascus sp. VKM F-4513 (FW-928)]